MKPCFACCCLSQSKVLFSDFQNKGLGQGCRYVLAEKKVIASWIFLMGNHLVKDNERFLGYAHTIIRYLNHMKRFEYIPS